MIKLENYYEDTAMVNNINKLPYSNGVKEQLSNLISVLIPFQFVDKIVLFGSYARMQQTVESDYDLLALVTEIPPREISGDLRSKFDELGADLLFYTEKQVQDGKSHIMQEIKKDGILLWSR